MGVHPGPVVHEYGFRHERNRLLVSPGHILDDVLENRHVVGLAQERGVLDVDLGLAGGADLVVVEFYLDPVLLEFERHLGP